MKKLILFIISFFIVGNAYSSSSLPPLPVPLPVTMGGTGGTTSAAALASLGVNNLNQTFYVSNTAGNGLPVGSDTNAGNFSSPFLTLQHALSVAPSNARIIVNCGTYIPASGTDFQLTLSVDIEAITYSPPATESCVTLQNASGFATTVEIAGSGINVVLGGIAIDGSSSATQTMLLDNSTAQNAVTLNQVTLANFAVNGVAEGSAGNFTLTGNNLGCTGTATGSCVNFMTHSSGNITLNGITVNQTAAGNDTKGEVVSFDAKVSGPTISVSHVVGTLTGSSNTSSPNYGILIYNAPGASVTYLGVPLGQTTSATFFSVQDATAGAGCTPVFIGNDPNNAIEADNPVYAYNNVEQNCVGGGHSSILWVSDGDPGASLRNLVQHARSHNNTDMSGPGITAAANLEGPLCGWTSDCWIYDNTIEAYPGLLNAAYGVIEKGVLGGYVFGNLIINPSHTGLLVKGGAEWNGGVNAQFYNNRIIVTQNFSSAIICLDQVVDENNSPATGWVFANNDCEFLTSGANPIRYVNQTGTGNTGTFSNNNYYTSGTGAGSGWEYAGTFASTLGAWQALSGGEPTALGINPQLTNDFKLNAGSPLIAAGTAVPVSVTSDLAGNPFYSTPSIGPYQYVGTNNTVGSTSQIPLFASQSAAGAAATTYYLPCSGALTALDTSETGVYQQNSVPGILRNLYVYLGTAPGVGNTTTVTVMTNTTASALTCTVSGAASTCTDLTDSVAISAGQSCNIQYVFSASATGSKIGTGVELDTQ